MPTVVVEVLLISLLVVCHLWHTTMADENLILCKKDTSCEETFMISGFVFSKEWNPVCGVDGKTYRNRCEFEFLKCLSRGRLEIAYSGECLAGGSDNPCKKVRMCKRCSSAKGYAECYEDEDGGRPSCPVICPRNLDHWCGTDGKTYGNRCDLEIKRCEQKGAFDAAYHGKCSATDDCDPCEHVLCPECSSDKGYAECFNDPGELYCPIYCEKSSDRWCGTDGKTYSNRCELEKSRCRKEGGFDAAHRGRCATRDTERWTRHSR